MTTSNQLIDMRFRNQMRTAMEAVRKILDLTRTPRFAADEDHLYDDKFGLAEFVVNSSIAAQINALERMGLNQDKLHTLVDMVHHDKRSVTLRFASKETCEFLQEREVEIESPRKHSSRVTESTIEGTGDDKSTTTTKSYEHKVTTKVKEYHWRVGVNYTLFCFSGSDSENDKIVLQSRDSSTVIITTGNKHEPVPPRSDHPIDVSLTWLLQNLSSDDLVCTFGIDRSKDTCHTPRRNDEIKDALDFIDAFKAWSHHCRDYFCYVEQNILGLHDPAGSDAPFQTRVSHIKPNGLFVPVLPLMEAPNDAGDNGEDTQATRSESLIVSMRPRSVSHASPLLSIGDINRFLQEQCRSLDEASDSLDEAHVSPEEKGEIISSNEARFVLLSLHLADIADQTRASVEYIEQMLHDQLVAAIGKEVHPKDFEEFLRFHNQKLLGPDYCPRPFCYAIRRPNHYPDGLLSIEMSDTQDSDKLEPIESIVRKISGDDAPPMFFPINAATSVEFTGERYLHAWVQHRFASSPRAPPKLVARARQFSSFLLMVGTIAGPDKFDPKDAIILQNKDEVMIPLLLNELPTPKEFKDAISSLSPEQQRFAKSFRGMQLESSVFGVCVVQLKPQLEALLDLPPDALTKEIGLTQDLLSLFIEYQIPSDLLSFDGPSDAPVETKVEAVKGYVKKVQEVIKDAKTRQLEEEVQKADMREETSFSRCFDGGPGPSSPKYGSAPGLVSAARRIGCAFDGMSARGPPLTAAQSMAVSEPVPRSAMMMMSACAAPPQASSLFAHSREIAADYGGAEAFVARDASNKSENKPSVLCNTQPFETSSGPTSEVDFTAIPHLLNTAFDQHDTDNALRTTIIKTEKAWTRKRQENLLTKAVTKGLGSAAQKSEKNKAFDLLDALSRSGSLPIACAELHVVLGVTHCFESTVMNTVIQDNINPIEKLEKSTLLIASTIHGVPANNLLKDGAASESAHLLASELSAPALPASSGEVGEAS